MNKELQLSPVANRIAVISSPTAAGYEDFLNQLNNNAEGFVFYTRLFPAIMQGEKTEESIIMALEAIYKHIEMFDAVAIIRGGGATSDLSSFDSYLLAANCAQFPLPIITGIGHERDDTVLDIVAHTRAKTPTAVAEFFIRVMHNTASGLAEIQETIEEAAKEQLEAAKTVLEKHSTRFSYIVKDMTKDGLALLDSFSGRLKHASQRLLAEENARCINLSVQVSFAAKTFTKDMQNRLSAYANTLKNISFNRIREEESRLSSHEQFIELVSPANILKKGYTLTLKGAHIVKSAKEIQQGDRLTTHFHDGEVSVKAE
jgi:exodeoxyribonuclease VII large subunit